MVRQLVLGAVVGLCGGMAAAGEPVRSLTPGEVEALHEGHGMGLALAAELNRYPGPRHVLDAAAAGTLSLSADQLDAVRRIHEGMRAEARRFGARVLLEERGLEAAFRAGAMTAGELDARVRRIAGLRGELRLVHLRAHLETRALLSPDQLARYHRLRGHADTPPPAASPPPPHRH